jgi:hypothetical protein
LRLRIKRLEEAIREKDEQRLEVLRNLNEASDTEWRKMWMSLFDLYKLGNEEQDRLNEELKMEQASREQIQLELDGTKVSIKETREMHQQQIDDLMTKLNMKELTCDGLEEEMYYLQEAQQDAENRQTMAYNSKVAELDWVKQQRDSVTQKYKSAMEELKSKDRTIQIYVQKCQYTESQMKQIIQERDEAIRQQKAAERHIEYLKGVDYYDDGMHQLLQQAMNRNSNKKRKYHC